MSLWKGKILKCSISCSGFSGNDGNYPLVNMETLFLVLRSPMMGTPHVIASLRETMSTRDPQQGHPSPEGG
ncbi:MAG: hypothetical protein AAF378_02930 [Cyanobacteria bacterium P01_A01_bin.84]